MNFLINETLKDEIATFARELYVNDPEKKCMDYDAILHACEAGEIQDEHMNSGTIKVIQDICVLIEFVKAGLYSHDIACVYYRKEMSSYIFTYQGKLFLGVIYNVLQEGEPQYNYLEANYEKNICLKTAIAHISDAFTE